MPAAKNNGGVTRLWTVVMSLGVMMLGWVLVEIATLKERVARGESERQANHDLMLTISEDLREMRADIKALLARKDRE